MDLFWLLIGLIVLLAVMLFNIIKAKDGAKFAAGIGNGVLLTILAGILILSKAEEARINDMSVNYNIIGGGIFSSVRYAGNSDGYNLFHQSNFITGTDFAVPESSCEVPAAVKLTGNVCIAHTGDIVLYKNIVDIDGISYNLLDSVVEIIPDTFSIRIIVLILTLIAAAGLNIVMFTIVLVQMKKDK